MNKIKELFRTVHNYFHVPYLHTLLITLTDGKKCYCERTAMTDFVGNESDYLKPRFRWGRFKLIEGVWNLFPYDGHGYIPYKDIVRWEIVSNDEMFKEYEAYRKKYYEEHPVELYLPECRSTLTKDFLKWLNTFNVQENIRNWVDGYGYSDAYHWESPDNLIEYIWKSGALYYNDEKVKSRQEKGKL